MRSARLSDVVSIMVHLAKIAQIRFQFLHKVYFVMAEQQQGGQPLTHFDAAGQAHMVDVGAKAETHRVARAEGTITMLPTTFALIASGSHKKGDVLGVARLAAIGGAKRCADLIPLAHPIPLTKVAVTFTTDVATSTVCIEVIAETVGRTGVEMEALTAASVGLLTIYDMCKAVDRGMLISAIRLLEKQGGKSGHWKAG